MGDREREDSEALGDIFLHPGGKFGGGLGVGGNEMIEAGLSRGEIGAIEDGADVGSHAGAPIETGNISLGVLLEVELATLPGNRGEDGSTGRGEAWMGIADDEGEAVKPSGLKRGQEVAPVNLGLAEGGADAENGAFPIGADPDGDEDGAVQELAALSDFFVSGVQDHVGTASQRAITPGLEFGIEFGGSGADLGGTDGMATEFLDDFGNFAGRDALDIHLGQGEHEGSFAADAFFQSAGIKVHTIAHLGNAELDGADTGGEGFGFEPVGAAQAAIAPFVGTGLEDCTALLHHGLINEEAQALGKAGRALRGQQLQNGVQKIRINVVGHVCVFVGCVLSHPNRKPHWPAPGELRASPIRGRLRSARYARLHSVGPGKGTQIVKSPITEETLHPPAARRREEFDFPLTSRGFVQSH